ncbi:glycosyl hydrolase [Streptomyces aureus]|uniref:glycosyl hydrolase n=1 Tax=Streptomyces aureus TaxID=193461 RepID=UPI0033CCBE08
MAPQQQRPRSGRLAFIAAGIVTSVALASGPVYAVGAGAVRTAGDPQPPTPTAAKRPPSSSATGTVRATGGARADAGTGAGGGRTAGGASAAGGARATGGVPGAGGAGTTGGFGTTAARPAGKPAPVSTAPSTAQPGAPAAAPATPGAGGVESAPPAGRGTTVPPAFGAYLDYGPEGIDRMEQLSRWLGGTELRVGHTYLPGDRWSNIEGAPGFLDAWADWRRRQADRMLVLNVPMMERNEEGLSDAQVRNLLREAGTGAFDQHFRALAEHLVELKVPDTVIVLGWEMNGITYTHRCGPDPEAWKAYWNRIVTAMRSVPGQRFRFDFAPSRGRDAVPWTECYPGDDTVDIIGMDAYDQPSGLSFEEQVKEPYGLQEQVDFAKAHGKSISYPEWGLYRNGDNPTYMRDMLAWMNEHKPLYNTLTDYCPHGVWQCQDNPLAAQAYRAALSHITDPAPTAPATEPTPATEPPPAPEPEPAPATEPASTPEAVPTPVKTETPEPVTTPTPTPTPVPKPVETPKPVEKPKPVETAKPVETPKPVEKPEPVPTPVKSEVPEPAPTPTPTPKPVKTPEPVETPKPVDKPAPVPAPVKTPVSEPSQTPVKSEAPEPAPQTAAPDPAGCTPVDLGAWVESWFGGKVCVPDTWSPDTWSPETWWSGDWWPRDW